MTINFGSLGLVVKCWTVAPGSGHRNFFLFQGGLGPSPKIEEKVTFVVVFLFCFLLQVVVLMVSIFRPVPADLDTFFESSPLLLLFVAFGRLLEHVAKVT